MTRRVLFYVQYLLGIGHVMRAARIARAMDAAGLDVHMVLGAPPIAGLDLGGVTAHHLPALKAEGGGYSNLVGEDGRPAGDTYKAARREALLRLFGALKPDALIIEAFPFGRRAMRFELVPLIEAAKAAHPAPLIVSSVRDILHENRKARLNEETAELAATGFDLILAHGDAALFPLADSFPLTARFADKVRQTGMVAPDAPVPWRGERHGVIVSAGGGAVGRQLLETAAAAKQLSSLRDARWCLVTGPNYPAGHLDTLRAAADAGTAITPFVPDLCSAMAAARLSISQCGYNTAADVMTARCRAVFVPAANDGETEQTRRAQRLSARGIGVMLCEVELSPASLAAAIEEAIGQPPPGAATLPDLGGAARSAQIIASELARREAAYG